MRPLLAVAFLSVVVWGCAPSAPVSADKVAPSKMSEGEFQKEAGNMTAAAWPTDVKIHRNKEGKVVCGVMGDEIASPDKANSFQDYKGVRYYFCCGSCPDLFKANPDKYAEAAPKTAGG